MSTTRKIVLKKDLVIPAGTELRCCDGETRRFVSGNYETTLAVGESRDSSGSLTYGFEPNDPVCREWFEEGGA